MDITDYFPSIVQIENYVSVDDDRSEAKALIHNQALSSGGESRVRRMNDRQKKAGLLVDRAICGTNKHAADTQLEHCHDYVELVYVYRGSICQKVNGKKIPMHKGQGCIMNCNTWHVESEVGKNDAALFIGVEKDVFKRFCQSAGILPKIIHPSFVEDSRCNGHLFFTFGAADEANGIMEQLCREFYEGKVGFELILQGLYLRFLSLLGSPNTECMTVSAKMHKGERSFIETETYVKSHLADVTRTSVAAALHFTPGYLNQLYKENSGKTFTSHLQDLRMERAASMLAQKEVSISEIIGAVGYSNRNHFYKLFREKYAMTPTDYRKIVQQ